LLAIVKVRGRTGAARRGGLVELDLPVSRDIGEGLYDSAGPANLDAVSLRAIAQPEVNTGIAGGQISA